MTLSDSPGGAHDIRRALNKDRRTEIAIKLATLTSAERLAYVRELMASLNVQVDTRTHEYRLRLMGRSATCTYSADGTIQNWIAATMKEAGLDKSRLDFAAGMTLIGFAFDLLDQIDWEAMHDCLSDRDGMLCFRDPTLFQQWNADPQRPLKIQATKAALEFMRSIRSIKEAGLG